MLAGFLGDLLGKAHIYTHQPLSSNPVSEAFGEMFPMASVLSVRLGIKTYITDRAQEQLLSVKCQTHSYLTCSTDRELGIKLIENASEILRRGASVMAQGWSCARNPPARGWRIQGRSICLEFSSEGQGCEVG